jgi:hypothetical protein
MLANVPAHAEHEPVSQRLTRPLSWCRATLASVAHGLSHCYIRSRSQPCTFVVLSPVLPVSTRPSKAFGTSTTVQAHQTRSLVDYLTSCDVQRRSASAEDRAVEDRGGATLSTANIE